MATFPLIGLSTYQRPVTFGQDELAFNGLTFAYIEAVRAAGGMPILLPQRANVDEIKTLVGRLDGLLLPGGGDIEPARYGEETLPACGSIDVERDALELELARQAVEQGLPLLAICRGVQVLNVALGGTLWQDLPTQAPGAMRHSCHGSENRTRLVHPVRLDPDSRVAAVLGTAEVETNSSHHQALRQVAAGLEVVGHAPDDVIEAVEMPAHPFALGVQWHPEGMYKKYPVMLRLFAALVEATDG